MRTVSENCPCPMRAVNPPGRTSVMTFIRLILIPGSFIGTLALLQEKETSWPHFFARKILLSHGRQRQRDERRGECGISPPSEKRKQRHQERPGKTEKIREMTAAPFRRPLSRLLTSSNL